MIRFQHKTAVLDVIICLLLLASCGRPSSSGSGADNANPNAPVTAQEPVRMRTHVEPVRAVCTTCGTVKAITPIRERGEGTGVSETEYKVNIEMENGSYKSITVPDASSLAVGTAVTVDGNNISLR